MTATLADFWPSLCPTLPPAWDTPANRANLAQLAGRMAPIPRVALECRLGEPAPHLDLQQCISRSEGEPAQLRDFILASQPAAREGDGAVSPALTGPLGPWARLLRFCRIWSDPTTLLHRGIAEIFLEYDLDTAPQPELTPSIFLSVEQLRTDPAVCEDVARAALELCLPTSWPPGLTDNLARCFRACPQGASVSYVGAMVGRPTRAVRVNVKRLRLDDLVAFLRAVGWSGDSAAVEQWAAWAYDRVDRVTVCLDVGDAIYPQVGLECVLNIQPVGEPRWEALLEELSAQGLCTSDNAAAFLSLPGTLGPTESETPWPAPWIAATLCGPTDRFSTTERRLSHVKVTVMGERVALKGYWGAGHVWQTVRPPASSAQAAPGRSDGSVRRALSDATGFVRSQQTQTGRWSDFLLPAGPSDEWVTAFVAACMLETGPETGYEPAMRGWRALLLRRRDEAGWGYNRLTPADADSTAWALRLAAGLGVTGDEQAGVAGRFLAGHLLAGGGLTTYAARDPIRRYTRLPESASFDGWQAAHACVTAAAAPVVGAPAVDYLTRQQAADGHWQGYWWWDDEYTTALAAEASNGTKVRAVAWAQDRVSATGAVHSTDGEPSPWATAWCVRILRFGTRPDAEDACGRAVQWLVRAQHDDGSWRASARLRVPMPGEVDAAGNEKALVGIDQNRVFTTAAVAAALSVSARASGETGRDALARGRP